MRVDIRSLPVSEQLGKGGFARISDLPGFSLNGEAGPFVVKRYHLGVVAKYHGIGPALAALIDVRRRLSAEDRAKLDTRTRWPLAMVTDGGVVVGSIMRRIPDRFFFDMTMSRGNRVRLARNADMYFCSEQASSRLGLAEFPLAGRVMAIARFAAHLELLHSIGVTVGDIQGGNLAVDPNGSDRTGPRICLYDCDSYRLRGAVPAIPQPHAMSWEPPELRKYWQQAAALPANSHKRTSLEARARVQTSSTDVYKFGLVMIRLLAMRDGISVSTDPEIARSVMAAPDVLGQRRTARLLTTLAPDPGDRPTMAEVMRMLTDG
jgi:hypothetical protein